MNRSLILSTLVLLLASCSQAPVSTKTLEEKYFTAMNGCFILYNIKTSQFEEVVGEENCKERYPACSTFKVALAVMAFDAKVLKDENEILRWSGKKESREVLNQDHNAKSWMQDSVVWFSQRLTPKIGKKKLQKYLTDFKYGNENLGAGITKAWLKAPDDTTGALRVSGYEQAEFMKNLWTNSLPVSQRSMDLAKNITYLETSPNGYKMSGKTGSNFFLDNQKRRLGWFIAHIEKGEDEYIAVTNFVDVYATNENSFGGYKARDITKQILAEKGLW
jgi:beta-lactamase class D